jgi:hypothetical protein
MGLVKDLAYSKLNIVTSNLLKSVINKKIIRYGRMLNLNLDSKNKSITLNVLLAGEESPLEIDIGRYDIVNQNDKYYLEINEVSTSRLWLNVLAEETLNGEKIEIPSKIAKLLKVVA